MNTCVPLFSFEVKVSNFSNSNFFLGEMRKQEGGRYTGGSGCMPCPGSTPYPISICISSLTFQPSMVQKHLVSSTAHLPPNPPRLTTSGDRLLNRYPPQAKMGWSPALGRQLYHASTYSHMPVTLRCQGNTRQPSWKQSLWTTRNCLCFQKFKQRDPESIAASYFSL